MSETFMYDFKAANVASVQATVEKNMEPGAVIAAYGTGSPDISWTARQMGLFPQFPIVTIDQGFTHSPVPFALVRDVERGAWTIHDAVNQPWPVVTPVIYCTRSSLPELRNRQWKGGVWVADPGFNPENPPLTFPGLRIVAVQYSWMGTFDKSIVYDTDWIYGFSVTPGHLMARAGWAPGFGHEWELIVKGKGGLGTGTSNVHRTYTTNHAVMTNLAPGWYVANVRVRNHPLWSVTREFQVSHV